MISTFAPSVRSLSSLSQRRNAAAPADQKASPKPAKAKTQTRAPRRYALRSPENEDLFMFPSFFNFDRLIDSFFDEPAFRDVKVCPEISANIKEAKNAYVVKVKLPGFSKEDISVKIGKDDVLSISAAKKSGEQSFSVVRRFQLPLGSGSRAKEAKGVMQNDTLTISIPKPKPKPKEAPSAIPIKYDE